MELQWTDHDRLVGNTFKNLFEDEALCDISLFCKNGSIKAHKLVLATCSPHFRRLFQENRGVDMVVLVSSITTEEMKLLLEYMYKGRVQFDPDLYRKLHKVADELGMENFATDGKSDVLFDRNVKEKGGDDKKKFFLKLNMSANDQECHNSNEQGYAGSSSLAKTILEYPDISIKGVQKNEKCKIDDSGPEISKNVTTDPQTQELESTKCLEDGQKSNECPPSLDEPKTNLICRICYVKFKNTKELSIHLQKHTKENKKPFVCEYCPSSFKRSSHLARHKYTHTGEKPFHCTQCEKSFSRLDKLRLHIRNAHNRPLEQREDLRMQKRPLDDPEANTESKRSRGRPRKPKCESQGTSNNYNLSNLPFGDLNYLTMPDGEESSDMPNMIMMEPLVQIDTTGEASRFCNQQPTIETTST